MAANLDVTSLPTGVTDLTTNETSTHIFDTYNVFIHPHWYKYPLVPATWHYAIGIYITIVGFCGIVGNSVVIYIFSTVKNLKTPSNMFIVNLAISDLVFSAVNGFPLLTISAFNKRWMFGQVACELYGLIGGIFGLMSINSLAAISMDRYYAIANPFQAAKNMTRRKAFFMILIVWAWSLASALPPLFGWGAYIPEGFQTSCTFDYLTVNPSATAYIMFLYIFGFAVPLTVIILAYLLIIRALKRHEREMMSMAKKMKVEDIKANQEKTKAEMRVAKVAMMIVALYLLSWSPYATVALIGQFGNSDWVTPYLSELPVMLAKAAAMHNPIVYALSHPKFREALFKKAPWLFCCCEPPSSASPSASKHRGVSRTTSGQSDVVGAQSDASSVLSNVTDLHPSNSMQMRKTGGTDQPINSNSTELIQTLVTALVQAQTQQQKLIQPIYVPAMSQAQQLPTVYGQGQNVYVVDPGNQQVDIKTHLIESAQGVGVSPVPGVSPAVGNTTTSSPSNISPNKTSEGKNETPESTQIQCDDGHV